MSDHLITVHYEVHDGDVTGYFLVPLPKIGIWEVLKVDLVESQWKVTNSSPSASRNWIGRAEMQQEAILDYLKKRLGMHE